MEDSEHAEMKHNYHENSLGPRTAQLRHKFIFH